MKNQKPAIYFKIVSIFNQSSKSQLQLLRAYFRGSHKSINFDSKKCAHHMPHKFGCIEALYDNHVIDPYQLSNGEFRVYNLSSWNWNTSHSFYLKIIVNNWNAIKTQYQKQEKCGIRQLHLIRELHEYLRRDCIFQLFKLLYSEFIKQLMLFFISLASITKHWRTWNQILSTDLTIVVRYSCKHWFFSLFQFWSFSYFRKIKKLNKLSQENCMNIIL